MRKIDTRDVQRATRGTPRQVNRSILLNLIRENQPISRADLARRLEMSRGMVSSLVSELLEEGIIVEGEVADAPRGRKPRLLHIRSDHRLVVGIDVGRTFTHVIVSDFAGTVLDLEGFRTPPGMENLVAELVERVNRMTEEQAEVGECVGVGIVVPGLVDGDTGIVLNAPTLGWFDVDVRAELARRIDYPVHIERDAVACALAHMWFEEPGRRPQNFAYLTVSDGVGAGLVVNGQVVRGRQAAAGEFGHVPMNLEGPPCFCGNRGCWEAYTSNAATVARYLGLDLGAPDARTELHDGDIGITEVVDAALDGDAAARKAIAETGKYLGVGLAGLVNALSPEQIIIGGEITRAWDIVEPELVAGLSERTLTESAATTPIVLEASDRDTRLNGAVALVVGPEYAAPRVA